MSTILRLFLLSNLCSLFLIHTIHGYRITHEVWFQVETKNLVRPGEVYRDKFTIGLFGDVVPLTVDNVVKIAEGYKIRDLLLHYKGTTIHKIVPDFIMQMGDLFKGDGSGGRSIYGKAFNDENFELKHRSPGWVAMANSGPDSNDSQFYITMHKARWLDGKHVVFGKVIRGFDTLLELNNAQVDKHTYKPKHTVRIVDCGAKKLKEPYDLPVTDMDSTEDLPEFQ